MTWSLPRTALALAGAASLVVAAGALAAHLRQVQADRALMARCATPPRLGPISFAAEFDQPGPLPGPQFLTLYKRWGNLRTLANNKEAELYIDNDLARQNGATPPFAWADGALRIRADTAPPSLRQGPGIRYTSGMITTEGSFAQRYGVFEMRARLPEGRGLWPAFWLVGLTDHGHYEIDGMEVLGHEPSRIYNSTVGPDRSYVFHRDATIPPSADGFHRFRIDWRPDVICFSTDGHLTNAAPNRFDVPMYVLANLAVGGSWGGYPDAATRLPAEMAIDYIRVYRSGR